MLARNPRSSRLSSLLTVVGAGLVVLALAADSLGIGAPGIGWRESSAIAVGAALLLFGLFAPDHRRRSISKAWRDAPQIAPGTCIALAVTSGLLIGFIEYGHQILRREWSARVMPWPDESIWLIPTCYAGFFLVIGAVLAIPVGRWRQLMNFPVTVFLIAALGIWSQLLLHPQLDPIPVIAISIGGAWHLARLATRRREATERFGRLGLPALTALTILIGLGLPVVKGHAEDSALDDLPAPPANSPNVILVVLDTVRTDHLQFHGYQRETSPLMKSLADRSVVFDWMMSTSSWTVPSHATLFTGRYTHQLIEAGWMDTLPPDPKTLAEVLTSNGYATGGFVGNINYTCADRGFGRGFSHYEDFHVTWEVAALASSFGQALLGQGPHRPRVRNDAERVTDGVMSWMEEQVGERPFFAFINYFDAHALYLPREGYDTLFGPRSPLLNAWRSQERGYTDEDMAGFERAYDGCIRFIDDQFRRIIERLKELGQLDNTLIVITGDHGEHFGEHGILSHANSLYSPTVHVPLLISYPDVITRPARVERFVSLRDVAATILDLTGLGADSGIPGQSLAPLWRDPTAQVSVSPALSDLRPAGGTRGKPSWWPISRGDMKSLGTEGLHFILNGDDVAELYDMSTDPNSLNDLIATPQGQTLEAGLREALQRAVKD